jgi:hypothetical protein
VDTPVQIPFAYASGLTLTPTHQYGLIFRMENPGINRIGLAGNDDSVKYYVRDYVQGNPPLGSEYQRQIVASGPYCTPSPPFIQDAIRDLNFYLTLGDGCALDSTGACVSANCPCTGG